MEEGRKLLRERFGPQVLSYVEAVTDDKTLPKAERKRLHGMESAVSVSLGPRILRADTAAVAAMTLWQSTLGDW